MAELPPNPIILRSPDQWVYSTGSEPLKYSRECELALENYDLKRYLKDVEDQNSKLKQSLMRVRSALKDSSHLNAEQQRKLNAQMRQISGFEKLNMNLKTELSDASLSTRCLSQGFSKQKSNQASLQKKMDRLSLETQAYKLER